MSVIVVLIGLSLAVAGSFLIAFLWAVHSGQFDDRETPAIRMLFEDKISTTTRNHTTKDTLKHGDRTL